MRSKENLSTSIEAGKIKMGTKLPRLIYSIVAMFLLYPAPLFAVHDGIGSYKCLRCHDRIPFKGVKSKIIPDYVEVCIECHNQYHGSNGLLHPLGMLPRYPLPKDMPLGQNGEVTCTTCHIFHPRNSLYVGDRATFLRRSSPKRLCMACHGALLSGLQK